MKKSLPLLVLPLILAACASGVKLNDVPVEDKAGTTNQAQSSVAPVTAVDTRAIDPGPQGVEKVVYFDFDSFVVKDDFRPVLEAHAKFLIANPTRKIVLQGNTDERGSREYNLALGDRRAKAASNYLVSLGIPASRIKTISYGKERPAVLGSNEAAWSQNRRGVTVLGGQ